MIPFAVSGLAGVPFLVRGRFFQWSIIPSITDTLKPESGMSSCAFLILPTWNSRRVPDCFTRLSGGGVRYVLRIQSA